MTPNELGPGRGSISSARPILVLCCGAALISFSPVFVKVAANERLGPTAIAFWRNVGGGCVLLALATARGSGWRLSTHATVFAMAAGSAFCADLFSWHRSIVYAGSGIATILANTQVFAAAVISFFIFKERLTIPFIVAASVALAGVALLVGIGSDEVTLSSMYVRGVMYGLVSGLAYSVYLVCLKKGQMVGKRPEPIVFVAWMSLFSALLLGIIGLVEGSNFLPDSAAGYLSLSGLAVLIQAVAWLAIGSALPRVATARVGLILLLQPTLAMVWGSIFFAEHLALLQILGAAVTLAAIYVGMTQRERPLRGETADHA